MAGTRIWIVPTLTGCYSYLQQNTLKEANYDQIPFDDAQNPLIADRFTQLVLEVTDSIRTKIQSISGFVVSATANSVPPELIGLAYGRIITRLENAFPVHAGVNEKIIKSWMDEWTSFMKSDDMSYYGFSFPPDPMTGDVQSNNPQIQVIRYYCREYTPYTLRGI